MRQTVVGLVQEDREHGAVEQCFAILFCCGREFGQYPGEVGLVEGVAMAASEHGHRFEAERGPMCSVHAIGHTTLRAETAGSRDPRRPIMGSTTKQRDRFTRGRIREEKGTARW